MIMLVIKPLFLPPFSYQNATSYKPIAAGELVEFQCAETGAKVGLSHNSSLFLECGADGQFPIVSQFCEVGSTRAITYLMSP